MCYPSELLYTPGANQFLLAKAPLPVLDCHRDFRTNGRTSILGRAIRDLVVRSLGRGSGPFLCLSARTKTKHCRLNDRRTRHANRCLRNVTHV